MRVMSGKYKGRGLSAKPAKHIRPSSSKLKEALMSMFRYDIEGAKVLDLFCGTGSVGFELLSNGAQHITLVDQDIRIAKENIAKLKLGAEVKLIKSDWRRALSLLNRQDLVYDFIFVDPPYAFVEISEILSEIDRFNLLHNSGTMVFEHSSKIQLKETGLKLKKQSSRMYGLSALSIYGS
jgi:16S rRNA (guanine966-N2)-methyltransferase